ncbi:MAG: short-chain dehydrogenase [Gammaproteobacteria bacterium]|nr:short-chain dehydrogenase [Gammaproteobacteria bacterium]MEC7367894.1 SDR family oxidoreductase [Pseudomonadota bacterium]
MNYIKDKTIVVTGAASGFGRLVAQKVSALGASVVVADINIEELAETLSSLENPDNAISVVADVADRNAVAQVSAEAFGRFGSIDIMLNNAGVMPLAFFSDHGVAAEAWDRCIDINIKGVLHGICAVYDQMISQGHGHVINVSSIYGNFPVVGAGVYGATKAAVNFLSESLRMESQGRIKVTTIKPTGVPATGLGAGVVNREAVIGILGANMSAYAQQSEALAAGQLPESQLDPERIEYFALEPDLLADQIVYAMNQPLGVSISELTVRASGDAYIL